MKLSLSFLALLLSASAGAQLRFHALGVGIDYNGGYNLIHEGLYTALEDATDFSSGNKGSIGVQRIGMIYRLGFRASNKEVFNLETDILQGTDYMSYSDYESSSRQSGDTTFTESAGYDFLNSAAFLGLRVRARISTPMEKRFHYNFGLALGATYFYNSLTYGLQSESSFIRTDTFFQFMETYPEEFEKSLLKPYWSYQITQQAGIAFRLGKDEQSFPLNRTYLELNVMVLTNFTLINSISSQHRTFGTGLSLVYEFR